MLEKNLRESCCIYKLFTTANSTQKVKKKSSFCCTFHAGADIQLHILTLASDGDEWKNSCHATLPEEKISNC